MKKIRQSSRFTTQNDAVAGIIVSILLVGLVLSVLFVIQTVYVPSWLEQKEADHMDDVADRFSMLKFAIDTQTIAQSNIPISTSIPLGSKEMPFFTSNRAFGYLRLSEDDFILEVFNGSSFTYTLGNIKYTSENSYFLDQTYVYEGGAIISSQDRGCVISVSPSFYVDYNYIISVDISFNTIQIIPIGNKISVSGSGTYPIQTRYFSCQNMTITHIDSINITTAYAPSWKDFFNTTVRDAGLVYGVSNDFWFIETGDTLSIHFDNSLDVELVLQIMQINTQIAPGWVE